MSASVLRDAGNYGIDAPVRRRKLTRSTTLARTAQDDACVQNDTTAARCSTCALRRKCLSTDLTWVELQQIESIVLITKCLRRGEALFRADDAFDSLYAVRTGSFKSLLMHHSGREQITGFQFPGEMLGLDGVGGGPHRCEVIALEDSTVCVIPFQRFDAVCHENQRMRRHLNHLMSSEIVRKSGFMMMLGTMTADQRLAAFLLDLSARFLALGYSGSQFNLKMSREEIGSFLGLTIETVSRMFSHFQRERLVESNGKQVRIVDHKGLARV